MSQERFIYLFNRFADKKHTPSEKQELMELINSGEYEQIFNELVSERWNDLPNESYKNEKADELFENIMSNVKVRKLSWYRKVSVAAAVLLFISGAYFYVNNTNNRQNPDIPAAKNDVAPGGNKAILTLVDGRQIILESAKQGTLFLQGNTKIIKLDEGQVSYDEFKTAIPDTLGIYNTITTPRAGQYQIELADGSKVWLNAASSLRFPVSFTGSVRNVELTGEAYFEIAKNAAMPFHVTVNDMQVEVLGTHFNVNAYADEESIKTTLLEGSVRIIIKEKSKIIKPGQQARIPKGQDDIIITVSDVDDVIAWKNGKFQFGEGADIPSVMRQIARWYDVDIKYKAKINGHIGGTISRNVNASQVFKMLEMTGGVKFEISDKKVTVSQ